LNNLLLTLGDANSLLNGLVLPTVSICRIEAMIWGKTYDMEGARPNTWDVDLVSMGTLNTSDLLLAVSDTRVLLGDFKKSERIN
jgi:hypothetical protein